ncbi:hypothetical protein T265_09529 [Opisthorchis viverrini]|uniref:Uncharacterized protein n=1 Tax=Opisthorchis viverrini TaxID=6198 RepID=A0A074Z5K6_OPIVI|nr:hypothetical protein T265_09529 [Opisthorchis viverrini]KER22358.1 hypothetical protein T265_09529 [Opisthorchis viverrini]
MIPGVYLSVLILRLTNGDEVNKGCPFYFLELNERKTECKSRKSVELRPIKARAYNLISGAAH